MDFLVLPEPLAMPFWAVGDGDEERAGYLAVRGRGTVKLRWAAQIKLGVCPTQRSVTPRRTLLNSARRLSNAHLPRYLAQKT